MKHSQANGAHMIDWSFPLHLLIKSYPSIIHPVAQQLLVKKTNVLKSAVLLYLHVSDLQEQILSSSDQPITTPYVKCLW